MKQHYDKYTSEDQEVWNTLFDRQQKNLREKGCEAYNSCLNELSSVLSKVSIPDFERLTEALLKETGWKIEVVKGLIPPEEFFLLLANKKFCSSTWLRNKSQLDYLEEPDMFHDIFGHVPLLANKKYAAFMQKFGELGARFTDNASIVKQLQRLYWFTIEFGLMKTGEGRKVYGAGIASSYGETNHALGENVTVKPFNIWEIVDTDFCSSEIQTLYFEIDSFHQLFESIELLKKKLESEVVSSERR